MRCPKLQISVPCRGRTCPELHACNFSQFFWLECKSGCTTPSHSQSLANFVANVHSQGISAARTKFSHFHSQNHAHSLANSFGMLHSQLPLWDLAAKIRQRILEARQNSHSHSQPYRCDRGALAGAWVCTFLVARVRSSMILEVCQWSRERTQVRLLRGHGGSTDTDDSSGAVFVSCGQVGK